MVGMAGDSNTCIYEENRLLIIYVRYLL